MHLRGLRGENPLSVSSVREISVRTLPRFCGETLAARENGAFVWENAGRKFQTSACLEIVVLFPVACMVREALPTTPT